ncbi:aminopeptidase P family protein [Lachnospiraceae bacterium 46-15]
MPDRIWKQEISADAVLVSDGYNMRYLSGFRGTDGYLFLTPGRKVLLTDSRYTTQAKEEAPEFEVMEIKGGRGYKEILAELLEKAGAKRLLFEDKHLVYADVLEMKERCAGIEWKPAGDLLNSLREVKTEGELALIRKAEAIGDQVFERILKDIRPGLTERRIAAKIDYYMKEMGAEGNSFDTIVASGVHSAMPHAIPSDKPIESGDFVTMDFGCVYEGYCSDMTRTIVVGTASARQKEIYGVVLQAQRTALREIRAGMTGCQADAAARRVIEEAGYGEYFGHGLGHSVGLFIHEEPRLSSKCHEVLRENMVETVEPGIYLPGFGGVRIEDLVRITAGGCENFTHSPKELIEL